MTTPNDETHSEYIARIADDGTGSVRSNSEIIDQIAAEFANMGTVYTDLGDIPSTATMRASGQFASPEDALEYLHRGGLVGSDGDDVIPLGFVYFYEEFDDTYYENIYTVYIDEDTN